MPKSAYVALGSTTTLKTGAGQVYGVTISGALGATVVLMDAVSIGATPDYSLITRSVPSNIAVISGMGSVPMPVALFAAPFYTGLVVSATSNASVTVEFD